MKKKVETTEAPTIREVANTLITRINQVMAAHGRNSGSLRAIQMVLGDVLRTQNPMMDSTAVPRQDGKRVPLIRRKETKDGR